MFRKLAIALGASAVIGAAALSPTAASAHGWHHHGWHHGWHYGFGIRFVVPAPVYYDDCYVVRRVVWTKWGKRVRRITVCD